MSKLQDATSTDRDSIPFIKRKYSPNDPCTKVVEEMFRRALLGEGKKTIAAALNEAGHATRQGKPWTLWNLTAILTNPIYAGAGHWDGALQYDAHEAIVRPTDFDEVQGRVGQGYSRPESYRLTKLGPDVPVVVPAKNRGPKPPPFRGR